MKISDKSGPPSLTLVQPGTDPDTVYAKCVNPETGPRLGNSGPVQNSGLGHFCASLVFGDLNQKATDLSSRIDVCVNQLQNNWTKDDEKDLATLHSRLNSILDDQQLFLDAKKYVWWLQERERNTGMLMLHAAIKIHHHTSTFKIVISDGSVSDDRKAMVFQLLSVNYF